MADDGAADNDQELQQLEDPLRGVGGRLQTPPDDTEDLLKLLSVSFLLTKLLFVSISVSVSFRVTSAAVFVFRFVASCYYQSSRLGVVSIESHRDCVLVLVCDDWMDWGFDFVRNALNFI
jgi:hypothetical protein